MSESDREMNRSPQVDDDDDDDDDLFVCVFRLLLTININDGDEWRMDDRKNDGRQ